MWTDPLLRSARDARMSAAMRLVLVLVAVLSTSIDPAETTHAEAATSTVLALSLASSLTLVTLAVRLCATIPATVAYWVVYLHPADKYHRLTRRPSKGQKGL
jgi:hypothetical protein